MEPLLLVGPGNSGKTRQLQQLYHNLARQSRTDQVLVLLARARDVRAWREEVTLDWAGPLHVYTYFGWVQREIRRHWLQLGDQWLEPDFLTVETSQFIMLDKLAGFQGKFAELVTSPERLAIQLGSCLVLSSLNGLDWRQTGRRLSAAMPDKDAQVFAAAQSVLVQYAAALGQAGTLDYGLAVELYGQMLKDDKYRRRLSQYRHLLVDDMDEQPPAAQEFARLMLGHVDSAAFAFSTDGGHSSFFGADPRGAWHSFAPRGRIRLVRRRAPGVLAGGGALYRALLTDNLPRRPVKGPELESLHEDLRSQMLGKVADRVVALVKGGVPAQEVAVLAPLVDKVLEHTLALRLEEAGIALHVLTKNRRLIDQPFVRAMMTLAILAHPHWELDWGVPDLAQSLQLLLKTDPVRAWLLSRQVREGRLLSLEPWFIKRVGFRVAEDYNKLKDWLEKYRQDREQPLDVFLQRVFGELLSRLPPGRDDLVVCRQLMESARKFVGTAARFPNLAQQPGPAFIRMLSAGTVAAESLLEPRDQDEAVILATPYAYISGHKCSRVQFWLDCTSRRWFHQDAREIINPHVLARSWPEGGQWSDAMDEFTRRLNGARTVRALLRRCRQRLVVASANVDSQGFEQDGPLLDTIFATLAAKEGTP